MITLLEKTVYPACPPDRGYLLRWYFNGWHYYNFIGGDESFTTTGAMHSTESSGKIKVGAAFLTRNDIRAIRGLLLSDQPAVLTSEGWKAVVIENTTLKVDGNDTEGYSCEFSITIYAKVADYSPVIPTPESVANDLDVLRYIRNNNPQSILPTLWSEDKDPHTEWWDADNYRGVLFGDSPSLQEVATNEGVVLPGTLDSDRVYIVYVGPDNSGQPVNPIVTVDRIKELSELRLLNLAEQGLSSIDVIGLSKLQVLDLTFNGQIGENGGLDLGGLTGLTNLVCVGLGLTSLQVNHLSNLKILSCGTNSLQSLNVSGLVNLEYLGANGNSIATIDLSTLENLKSLDVTSNDLNILSIGNNVLLESLMCGGNHITDLDLTGLIHLQQIGCESNGMQTLNIANATNLQSIECSNNDLQEIDISSLDNLFELYCANNHISYLETSNMPSLRSLHAKTNDLLSLDISESTGIQQLDVSFNRLQSLTLPVLYISLSDLYVQYNNLAAIDRLINKYSISNYDFTFNAMPVTETNRIAALGFDPQYILPQNP